MVAWSLVGLLVLPSTDEQGSSPHAAEFFFYKDCSMSMESLVVLTSTIQPLHLAPWTSMRRQCTIEQTRVFMTKPKSRLHYINSAPQWPPQVSQTTLAITYISLSPRPPFYWHGSRCCTPRYRLGSCGQHHFD